MNYSNQPHRKSYATLLSWIETTLRRRPGASGTTLPELLADQEHHLPAWLACLVATLHEVGVVGVDRSMALARTDFAHILRLGRMALSAIPTATANRAPLGEEDGSVDATSPSAARIRTEPDALSVAHDLWMAVVILCGEDVESKTPRGRF